jgi:exodeoxyribonuclease-3
MRVITWNCNMAFRKKAVFILKYKPDILIVPECEHPDKLQFKKGTRSPNNILWFGTNRHKGLCVFSYNDYKLKKIKTHNPEIRMVVPIGVTGGEFDFTLFAIWANNPFDPEGQYVEQIWKALSHYDSQISSEKTMLVGDFNSNTIWDRKYRIGNHSNVVKVLEDKGIQSSYHLHYRQTQGKEKHPTFYLYRHKDKAYHIDYCFISADLAKKLQKVTVGNYNFWKAHSDHAPVIVTFGSIHTS